MIDVLIILGVQVASIVIGTLIAWCLPLLYCIEPGCTNKVPIIVGMRKSSDWSCKIHREN